jgi:hypothetical protein
MTLVVGSLGGVILSKAVFQAERRIWRAAATVPCEIPRPLVKTRGIGMTQQWEFQVSHYPDASLTLPRGGFYP